VIFYILKKHFLKKFKKQGGFISN